MTYIPIPKGTIGSTYYLSKYIYSKDGKTRMIDTYYLALPPVVINYMINCNILIEDSGNFETGEIHYILNTNRDKSIKEGWDNKLLFTDLIPVLREIRLNKLFKL